MLQASSFLVNMELVSLPGDILVSFARTSTVVGVVAFMVFTAMALYAGSDSSWERNATPAKVRTKVRLSLGVSMLFGLAALVFFFAVTFFMQAAVVTHNLSNPVGFIVGVTQTLVAYVVIIVLSTVIYLIPRIIRSTSEFFHRHPMRLG